MATSHSKPVTEEDRLADSYLQQIKHASPREIADSEMEKGMLSVIRAFNLIDCAEVPWSFSPDTRARAEELCAELTALFHDSTLTPRADRLTRRDAGFQRFIGKLAR